MSENLTVRLQGRHVDWLLLDEVSGIVSLRGNADLADVAAVHKDISWTG